MKCLVCGGPVHGDKNNTRAADKLPTRCYWCGTWQETERGGAGNMAPMLALGLCTPNEVRASFGLIPK